LLKIKIKTKTRKVQAIKNLDKNVEIVYSKTSFDFFINASSELCTPRESEKAFATVIIIIHPITTNFDFDTEASIITRPNVVIIPYVNPKPNPFLKDILNNLRLKVNQIDIKSHCF
jgi:hypothetical protein